MDTYDICKKDINNSEVCVTLGKKGSQGINTASEKRLDTVTAVAGQHVITKSQFQSNI